MTKRATSGRRWRIGELADATGLTVRALRHYEHVGLLRPRSRTAGRQRLYDEDDVRRIYRICALRDIGLPLTTIARMLDRDRAALGDVLRAHRARVDAEIARLESLRAMLDLVGAKDAIDPDVMLATIEATSRVLRRSDARRREGSAPKDVEARWRALGRELRACMNAGEPPSAPAPRAIAREARARIVDFAGGDPATLEALAHLRRFAPPKDLAGWDPPLMRYLDEALTALGETEERA
ncbi:MerR family transcriptional regulator [Sandaracinus amylolyticus]|uniref:Transcriptional regulator, MerR family protein n=1 Tax=Sandaracinus amylolyticus TaxID=927083 RepID=A0A0F6YMZ1_9BACT|nr:MerR family transcriptional regulator [Sandaracinus amylolyticus]AKF11632.1 transcriptional regulator, MerR family protein [Sandaracinus amylolyticus]